MCHIAVRLFETVVDVVEHQLLQVLHRWPFVYAQTFAQQNEQALEQDGRIGDLVLRLRDLEQNEHLLPVHVVHVERQAFLDRLLFRGVLRRLRRTARRQGVRVDQVTDHLAVVQEVD